MVSIAALERELGEAVALRQAAEPRDFPAALARERALRGHLEEAERKARPRRRKAPESYEFEVEHPRARAGRFAEKSKPAPDPKKRRKAKPKTRARKQSLQPGTSQAWALVLSLNQASRTTGPTFEDTVTAGDRSSRAWHRIRAATPGLSEHQRIDWVNQTALAHERAVWGPVLQVSGLQDPITARVVRNLSRFPDSVARKLVAAGMHHIVIGRQAVSQLYPAVFSYGAPRGHPGEDWDRVGAFYAPSVKDIVVGGANSDIGGTGIEHELGHAMGDLLGLDNAPELIAEHQRLYSTLPPYFQMDGPGGAAGRQEFLAETVRGALAAYSDPRFGLQSQLSPSYRAWIRQQLGLS